MPLLNTRARYGAVARAFHWGMALLIIGMLALGWIMGTLPNNPGKAQAYTFHKSLGLVILTLVALRLLWRLYSPAPPEVPGLPGWMRLAARLSHWALYGFMFAMPLSGWLLNSAAGRPLNLFGNPRLPVPALTGADANIRALADQAHNLLAYGLAALLAVHAGAALFHHFIRRDATLARMTPLVNPPHPTKA